MLKWLRELGRHLVKEHRQPERMGAAVALGLLVGATPFYGLHLAICIALASLFRLNRITVYLAANISNPLFAPFLVAADIAVGEWVRFGTWRSIDQQAGAAFIDQLALWSWRIPDLFLSAVVGSLFVGLALAVPGGLITWAWGKWWRGRKEGAEE